jgi:hypothetical protein
MTDETVVGTVVPAKGIQLTGGPLVQGKASRTGFAAMCASARPPHRWLGSMAVAMMPRQRSGYRHQVTGQHGHLHHRARLTHKSGLTLLELVIVLTIIVAIAGVAVAMFPRLLTRAHVASCSANLPELFKAIQTYDAISMNGYPDRVDTMVVNSLATYVPAGVAAELTVEALQPEEAEALVDAGIREVTVMIDNPARPSFWPYDEPVNFAPVTEPDSGRIPQSSGRAAFRILVGRRRALRGVRTGRSVPHVRPHDERGAGAFLGRRRGQPEPAVHALRRDLPGRWADGGHDRPELRCR